MSPTPRNRIQQEEARRYRDARQRAIANWAVNMFGDMAVMLKERGLRFLEEAIELGQCCGLAAEDLVHLVSRVYRKPVGNVYQEVGGVGTTFECLAQVLNTSAEQATADAFERNQRISKEDWTSRHAKKSSDGILGKPVLDWQPIATAPKDGTYVLLRGPSGYRVEVGHWDVAYRNWWINYANDAFTDGGEEATHWAPLPW